MSEDKAVIQINVKKIQTKKDSKVTFRKSESFNPGPAKINPNMSTTIFGKLPVKKKPYTSSDTEVSA
jgi:hypothetical protein